MKSKLINIVSILIMILYGTGAIAQETKSVSGVVTVFRNLPLNKAKVIALKSGKTAYTDASGQFTIEIFKKDVLEVSASGFEGEKIKVGNGNIYAIDLLYKDNVANFNKAINGGHVTETALQKGIKADRLKKEKDYSKYNSIYELIASEIYGVRVNGYNVYNKEIRSMNANPQVLYVVDMKVVSDISFVVPADVKKIEFIDDVGATMWGVQGANGVLKITLK